MFLDQAYYSSASDDEITLRENRLAYQRYISFYFYFAFYLRFIAQNLEFGSGLASFEMFRQLIGLPQFLAKSLVFLCIS